MLGEKIEFPFNNEMYLKQAVKHIENSEYEDALSYIEKVYETDKSYYVNHFHTLVLYTLERYEEALEVANEYKSTYLKNEQHILMYTMLLIKNHQFLEAEAIIQKQQSEPFLMFQQEWENLERDLNLERELLNFEIEMKRKATKRKLYELHNYSIMEQSQILHEARELTLEDLQEVCLHLFSDPFVSGRTQRALLEILVEMGDDNTYLFSWFNQTREICPSELSTFNDLPMVENIDDLLENKLHKTPSLIEVIKAEIINDLLMLYPFVEETISDYDYWIDLYIAQFVDDEEYFNTLAPKNQEQVKLQTWMQHLNHGVQRP